MALNALDVVRQIIYISFTTSRCLGPAETTQRTFNCFAAAAI